MVMVLSAEQGQRQIVEMLLHTQPCLFFGVAFRDGTGLFFFFLVELEPSLAASAGFITEWQPLHPLPELLDSNSKQEPSPWLRPEAAHCSLEAGESQACCQATLYGWAGLGGGVNGGVLHRWPRPRLSFVIVTSR